MGDDVDFSSAMPPMVMMLWTVAAYCVGDVIMYQWITVQTAVGMANFLLYTFLMTMMAASYLLAVLSKPGQATPDWEEHYEAKPLPPTAENRVATRFCSHCQVNKPPRAHHCRICGVCVLRMDHHCPWINNCVGAHNYKYFFLFLVYTVISCTYSFAAICFFGAHNLSTRARRSRRRMRHGHEASPLPSPTPDPSTLGPDGEPDFWSFSVPPALTTVTVPQTVAMMLTALVAITFAIGVTALLVWHISLISKNSTTIAYYRQGEEEAVFTDPADGKTYAHVYNLGCWANWRDILGGSPLLWLLPIPNKHWDGVNFPTRVAPSSLVAAYAYESSSSEDNGRWTEDEAFP